jgi:hypothetical protein
LLNALINHKLIKDKTNLPAIVKLFKPFRGWESYLVLYFWRSLSVNPALQGEAIKAGAIEGGTLESETT